MKGEYWILLDRNVGQVLFNGYLKRVERIVKYIWYILYFKTKIFKGALK